MTQFQEGQEVEVTKLFDCGVAIYGWHKAKIIKSACQQDKWLVEFPDNTRAVFDEDHIRRTPQAMAQAFYDSPLAKPAK